MTIHRVHIREHVPGDLAAHVDWQTDPEVGRHLSWLPRSRPDAENGLRDAIEQQMIEDAFRTGDIDVLTSSRRRANEASARIMARCGFVLIRESDERLWFRRSCGR